MDVPVLALSPPAQADTVSFCVGSVIFGGSV